MEALASICRETGKIAVLPFSPQTETRHFNMVQDQLRRRFNEAPALYDRARPRYPAEVFDDLIAMTALPLGGRILEIGCGTGIATEPLAERGYQITAVELGAELA